MENRIGFGPRLLALLIDFASMWLLALIFYLIVPQLVQPFVDYQMAQAGEATFSQIPFDITPVFVFINLLIFARVIIFSTEIAFGTSLGKFLLKLKITDRMENKPSIGQLVARYSIKHIYPLLNLISIILYNDIFGTIGGILGFVVFVGCFFALGDKKLTLQDLISNTMVISANKTEQSTSSWIADSEPTQSIN